VKSGEVGGMNEQQFGKGTRVAYVPIHANGDITHPDVEHGTVSSSNEKGTVFVKFDKQLLKFGWEGTTSQGCSPDSLVRIFDHQTLHAVPMV
jgi:hypothetical protein